MTKSESNEIFPTVGRHSPDMSSPLIHVDRSTTCYIQHQRQWIPANPVATSQNSEADWLTWLWFSSDCRDVMQWQQVYLNISLWIIRLKWFPRSELHIYKINGTVIKAHRSFLMFPQNHRHQYFQRWTRKLYLKGLTIYK